MPNADDQNTRLCVWGDFVLIKSEHQNKYDSTMAQMVHFFTSIRILNSEFRNSEFRILNSEFRISKKNLVYRNFVFGDDTSGSVHGVEPFDLKLEQFKQ